MPEPDIAAFSTAVAPLTWPEPPGEMTVSTLAEIEACPRRWALMLADYPEIWSGRGYPSKPSLGALTGSVLHLAVETVARELVLAGCPSVEDPMAVGVMRGLGGY